MAPTRSWQVLTGVAEEWMLDKPLQWGEKYGTIFQDRSVVAAYHCRASYPPEILNLLTGLLAPGAAGRLVLDAGCGTGDIARAIAPLVDHVDAVDVSEAMIQTAKTLPGGNRSNIRWISAPIEVAPLSGAYALIVAAASLQWMDWERAVPRFADHLVPGGVLAAVEEQAEPNPWDTVVGPILGRYSMNTDFEPYSLMTVVTALEDGGVFRLIGRADTAAATFRQPVAEWIESFHARNGFSRDRMEPGEAMAFDQALRTAIDPYCPDGIVTQEIKARLLWGQPLKATP